MLWIMFSPIDCDRRGLMLDLLPDFLAAYGMKPYGSTPIEHRRPVDRPGRPEWRDADDLSVMLAAGNGKLGVDLTFYMPEESRYVRFIVLDQEMPSTLCVSIAREILGEDHKRFGKSGWIVDFISKLANKLGSKCCLSARDDRFLQAHESLDVLEFLDQLKSGQLLESVPPVILVVREDLASAEELSELVSRRPELGFRLEHDGACHVLWSMGPSPMTREDLERINAALQMKLFLIKEKTTAKVASLVDTIANLAHENALLKRRLFGNEPERSHTSEAQLALGDLLAAEAQLQNELNAAIEGAIDPDPERGSKPPGGPRDGAKATPKGSP
jgi:hypothetical protein